MVGPTSFVLTTKPDNERQEQSEGRAKQGQDKHSKFLVFLFHLTAAAAESRQGRLWNEWWGVLWWSTEPFLELLLAGGGQRRARRKKEGGREVREGKSRRGTPYDYQ